MDKVRRDKRKKVHARLDFGEDSHHSCVRARTTKPERLKVRDRLRYDDRHVLDRLGHRRQSAFDRLSETYSPSTTKSRPRGTDSRDHPWGRSRPRRLDTSNEDCPEDRERFRGVGESYDDSYSHSYRDENPSRHMKRKRDNESPLSSVSKSDSSDGRFHGMVQSGNVRMKGAPECMRISGFIHGVNNLELTKRLNEHVPKTMEKIMIATTAFIRGEAAAASKKKGHTSWRAQDQSKRKTSEKKSDFRGHPREERGSSRFTPLTRTPKEILAVKVGKFQPSPPMVTPVEKRNSNKFCDFRNDKGHSTDESSSGVERPLVIETEIGRYMIHRMYVDRGDADHSTRAWMNFMIVRSLSPYNGIIGRPEIREIQAVPSTAHEMLKFPVEGGIVTIHSTILKPAECTLVITSSAVPKEEGTRLENFKVALHPDFSDQKVAIRGTLLAKRRTELCSILKKKLNIFAWQPSNMTGVPRSVAEHRLNIREGYSHVWQKKRDQAPERAKAIHAEVQKLVEAGIMKEVYYHDLLSNPVMVKKHDGSWRIDVDETFRTLRKINMKLNPKKCTFGAAERVFLGYVVTPEGIKPCPDKTTIVLQLPFPRTIKEVQSLNGKLASLNRFLSKSTEKSLPLFKTLKKCIKKSDFHWTAKAEQAFKQLKQHLSELPLLVAPKPKEELIVYLSATYEAISTGIFLSKCRTLFTDGSSCVDGSGAGIILTSPEGTEFTYALRFQFAASNNEAEYEALIVGLRIAAQMGGQNVHVSVDSKLVANQVLGTYVAKEEKHDQVPGQSQKLGHQIHQLFHKPSTTKQEQKSRCPKQNRVNQLRALVQTAKAVATITDSQVKKFVWDNIVCRFGLPGEIVSDSDKQFNDNLFKDWCDKLHITQRFASVKHPQSNGLVERANRSLGEGIKARLGEGNKNWVEELPHVLWAHRTMIKSSHGDTPFSLTYKTEAVIPTEIGMPTHRTVEVDVVYNDEELQLNLNLLEERRERAAIREAKSKLKMTKYYNARVRGVTFSPSDFVYRNNDASHAVEGEKLGPKWEGPYEMVDGVGRNYPGSNGKIDIVFLEVILATKEIYEHCLGHTRF
nr:reverse transcriptase domain-containing protein [Tanacetum cinerariifolium]